MPKSQNIFETKIEHLVSTPVWKYIRLPWELDPCTCVFEILLTDVLKYEKSAKYLVSSEKYCDTSVGNLDAKNPLTIRGGIF